MDLTIHEVATLLGLTDRAIRARIRAGTLAAVKRGGRWLVPRRAIPLNDAEQRALQHRAELMREAVERALPSRATDRLETRHRSLEDVEAFRALRETHRAASAAGAPPAVVDALRGACGALSRGHHLFAPREKALHLDAARCTVASLVADLLMESPESPTSASLAMRLEREVLPKLGRLARRAESLPARGPAR